MKRNEIRQLREQNLGVTVFVSEVLEWIGNHNLWNLWVPKSYGGLELSLSEGLQKLKTLAYIDGSLGWTITLCSGANYFVGNLDKDIAQLLFLNERPPILGGSGGVFGVAEEYEGYYRISGNWQYATGSLYLSHFTLNAKILKNGKEVKEKDGSPMVRSFVLPKEKVKVVPDWDAMGLVATVTHSFEVNDVKIDRKYSFQYNEVYLSQPIFKIPFSLFVDITLWVNYLGMVEHFLEESQPFLSDKKLQSLKTAISYANQKIFHFSEEIENTIQEQKCFTKEYMQKVHSCAVDSVSDFSRALIEVYPNLGIKACRKEHPLNQIFRDYFTATQHHVFSREGKNNIH
ncbi:acyl-CoA dehydrogenase [Aurantibacter crassamenti]|nr:acyl-CoA dehydrogenase [Aurantibacter crassamenti]